MQAYEIITNDLKIDKKILMECLEHAKKTYEQVDAIEVTAYGSGSIILEVEEKDKSWHKTFGKLVKSRHNYDSESVFQWKSHSYKTQRFGGK